MFIERWLHVISDLNWWTYSAPLVCGDNLVRCFVNIFALFVSEASSSAFYSTLSFGVLRVQLSIWEIPILLYVHDYLDFVQSNSSQISPY